MPGKTYCAMSSWGFLRVGKIIRGHQNWGTSIGHQPYRRKGACYGTGSVLVSGEWRRPKGSRPREKYRWALAGKGEKKGRPNPRGGAASNGLQGPLREVSLAFSLRGNCLRCGQPGTGPAGKTQKARRARVWKKSRKGSVFRQEPGAPPVRKKEAFERKGSPIN